ncbi:hypothetical protein F5J12DRAFT_127239 [Pisolithus orientalis]|uniref:uncharacterized protein n=1 Tax=Pisolithus orientalis TaxID=936130 RepID=UPI0022251C57|nr:uncharacterized protein F5J12DRAFT_127239 [Pisolithus orientalis]KAI6005144.1 hypothetical protein F5J12DRAFT_127239 [Pisolithus orientalis]
MPHSDSDDEFPNDFDGVDFSAVPELQAQQLPPSQAGPSTIPSSQSDRAGTPTSGQGIGIVTPISGTRSTSRASSHFDSFDELDVDPYLLAAIDEIESRALREHQSGTVPAFPEPPFANVSPLGDFGKGKKRSIAECDFDSQVLITPPVVLRLDAPKSNSGESLQTILEGYENEIMCPICCDILVAAFMCNPCGHTTCGDCGYGWISRNKYSPTCAVCRSELIKSKPLLPNYAIDNVVKHHISALAESGRTEWQKQGYRLIDWKKRLDAWKKQYPSILAEENAREVRTRQPVDHPAEYYESLRRALNYSPAPPPPTSNRRSRRNRRHH